MKNKKGFIGGLLSIIITVAIILGMYLWWEKMTVKNLQDTTKKAAQDAGVEINTQDASPQGQVNAVRDAVNKIQDKENAEIANQIENQPQATEEANIVVSSPEKNATVNSPFYIEGKARVFENVVSIRLEDKDGKILFQGTTDAQSPNTGQYGLFQKEIKYTTSQTEGILKVFESSAKDGSEINEVIIPVKFGN